LLELKDWLTIAGVVIAVMGNILHVNAKFAELNTKVDLMYKCFEQGIFQPFILKGKNDGN
jgi:hypothetical protein